MRRCIHAFPNLDTASQSDSLGVRGFEPFPNFTTCGMGFPFDFSVFRSLKKVNYFVFLFCGALCCVFVVAAGPKTRSKTGSLKGGHYYESTSGIDLRSAVFLGCPRWRAGPGKPKKGRKRKAAKKSANVEKARTFGLFVVFFSVSPAPHAIGDNPMHFKIGNLEDLQVFQFQNALGCPRRHLAPAKA